MPVVSTYKQAGSHVVSRSDLERSLERVRAAVGDPKAGIHGPGSLSWELAKEGALFLGGGRAALLQLAHPFVAYAVRDHSHTKADPRRRFIRTFENVWAMTFGDLDQAFRAARRVHQVHSRITGVIGEEIGSYREGTVYQANQADALLWVYATLAGTTVQVYELVVGRLGREEKERYYQETKLFAYLFGIPDSIIPADWPGFTHYMETMLASTRIAVAPPAVEVARFVLQSPHPLLIPVAGWYKVVTAGLLPNRLGRQFGLRFGPADRVLFQTSIRLLHTLLRALPGRLRYLPAYVAAQRRLG